MARELTLNDPLSGQEIKQIILQKIAEALDRDCTLVNDIAYPGFSLSFEAKVGYVRSATPPTLVWGNDSRGIYGGPKEKVSAEYKTDSPDKAREENNLPLPVMVQTPSGPKRMKVPFQRPHEKNRA